jgi:hypothetical protein
MRPTRHDRGAPTFAGNFGEPFGLAVGQDKRFLAERDIRQVRVKTTLAQHQAPDPVG